MDTTCFVVLLLCLGIVKTEYSKKEIEELAVGLEFAEFELEDHCITRNDVYWNFYRDDSYNFTSQLLEKEVHAATQLKSEINQNVKYKEEKVPVARTQRMLDILFTSGPALLDQTIYTEYLTFVAEAENSRTSPSYTNLTHLHVQNTLRNSKSVEELENTWTEWVTAVQNSSSRDLTQQISLLNLEAEANGADSVEKYWLAQSEVTKENYDSLYKLWITLVPLYQKLRLFLASSIAKKLGSDVFTDPKRVPVHLLGSLDSTDWVTAAESTGALKESSTYTELQSTMKNRTVYDLYKAADDVTAELRLGYISDDFFTNSIFNGKGNRCTHYAQEKCKSGITAKVLHCEKDSPSVSSFLRANEEITRLKHMAVASIDTTDTNGYLLRAGPRDSVLYEAIATASSLLAVQPQNLLRRGLIKQDQADANMTSLLLAALHILPPLPLHLSYDLWRLKAIQADNGEETTMAPSTNLPTTTTSTTTPKTTTESWTVDSDEEQNDDPSSEENDDVTVEATLINSAPTKIEEKDLEEVTEESTDASTPMVTYTRENLTRDWWEIRGKLQGMGPPNSEQQYQDFLLDSRVIMNKAHISKFLGPIVLFQILGQFKTENTSENLDLLQQLLRKGKSEPWEKIVEDLFNITKLNTEPLLEYFKPLETFLDAGANFKENSTDNTKAFSANDLTSMFTSSSVKTGDKKNDVLAASEDSNALMIFLVGLAVVGIAATVFSVVRKRMAKRRKAKDRRQYGA